MIPPVAPTAGQQQASSGSSDPYAQTNKGPSGDPYARAKPAGGASSDPYARAGGAGGGGGDPYAQTAQGRAGDYNPYAKKGGENDQARSELFSGFSAPEKPQAERKYGYEGREMEEDFDEDEEIEGIKQEMRGVKQESLASTRNALRLAREAEETARGTIAKLGDQSERIANSERYLDMAKANNQRAEDRTGELKQLNRSIFRPVITWNKDAKRQAQEDKINERHDMERIDRQQALNDISSTRQRLGQAANPAPGMSRQPLPGERKAKQEARSRYQFDATASDDELEDELDDNLDETYEVTKRLKNLATAMGDEVTGQNARLGRVTNKTEDLEYGVARTTNKLANIR